MFFGFVIIVFNMFVLVFYIEKKIIIFMNGNISLLVILKILKILFILLWDFFFYFCIGKCCRVIVVLVLEYR